MLVLTRKAGGKIHIGSDSAIIVVSVKGNNIQIDIDSPKEVEVLRVERREVLDHFALLNDAAETACCQAAESLAMEKRSDEAAASALVKLLEGAGAGVKAAAARALGTLKKAAAPAVSALIPLLHDPDETVRTAAAEAIAQFGKLSEAAAGSLLEDLAGPGEKNMGKIRVLIADDHAIVRAGIRLLINNQPDMEVVGEAGDGHEALRQSRQANPDVLTLDLTMPGGGGLKALEGLREACPQTRALVLTMHEDPSYLRAALATGALGYVAKSAVDGDLLAAIRSVAQGRTFVTMNLSDRGTHQVLGDQPTRTESPARVPVKLLSSREQEVLKLLAQGYTNKEAGTQLCLSVKSIETYRARLGDKLGLRSRADLTRFALEIGLLEPGPSSPGQLSVPPPVSGFSR